MAYVEKSDSFEDFLDRLNDALISSFPLRPTRPPHHNFCQIVGLPRSGTTILFQLLAGTGAVGYPSNVMAPYWRVPIVGARLQRQLTVGQPTVSLHSVAGRTSEPLDPHEFGYFWRDALGHSGNTLLPDRPGWSWRHLQDALDAICEAFDAPTVHKNFLALHHAPAMRHQLKRSKFLVMQRDPREVASSLWSVRRTINVPDEATFGLDPGVTTEGELSDRIIEQVATLERARLKLVDQDQNDTLVIDYERLCREPREVVSEALRFLGVDNGDSTVATIPSRLTKSPTRSRVPNFILDKFDASL